MRVAVEIFYPTFPMAYLQNMTKGREKRIIRPASLIPMHSVMSNAYCQLSCSFATGHASQLTFALIKPYSHTVFPAPLGPTNTVRGVKKEMTCLSLSSIPKLLTPRMLILSIFDIFAF